MKSKTRSAYFRTENYCSVSEKNSAASKRCLWSAGNFLAALEAGSRPSDTDLCVEELPTAACLLLRNRSLFAQSFHGPDGANVLFAEFWVFAVVFLATVPALRGAVSHRLAAGRKESLELWGEISPLLQIGRRTFSFYFDMRVDPGAKQLQCMEAPAILFCCSSCCLSVSRCSSVWSFCESCK